MPNTSYYTPYKPLSTKLTTYNHDSYSDIPSTCTPSHDRFLSLLGLSMLHQVIDSLGIMSYNQTNSQILCLYLLVILYLDIFDSCKHILIWSDQWPMIFFRKYGISQFINKFITYYKQVECPFASSLSTA
jgi:hypothetical protein